jgi:DNA polymerase IV
MTSKWIYLIDMQSFYASVEKAENPMIEHKPIIVAGDPERRSGIVLAACPIAKQFGVTTAETIGEALAKCPQLVIVRPRMQTYIDYSLHISEILHRFSDLVEPYSIDEQFVDVTGLERLFGDPIRMAQLIRSTIQIETNINARVGIGRNKVSSKLACDNFAKKHPDGVFMLTPDNLESELWPLPVHKMFGVGNRMHRHFLRMGIDTIGDLARTPLPRLKDMLRARFGKNADIHATVLWMTANGIDHSPVTPETHVGQKAVGHHMTLPKDYHSPEDLKIVLLELCEEVCRRSRFKGYAGATVSLGVRGADFDRPTGFSRQTTLPYPTNHAWDVYQAACRLFDEYWDQHPVRSLGVTLSKLCFDSILQLDLFHDRWKQRELDRTVDSIKHRYGSAAIIRASSLTAAGQATERSAKIGGHYK